MLKVFLSVGRVVSFVCVVLRKKRSTQPTWLSIEGRRELWIAGSASTGTYVPDIDSHVGWVERFFRSTTISDKFYFLSNFR
jgi:hypothetical protein